MSDLENILNLMYRIDEGYRRFSSGINESGFLITESQESKSIAAAKKLVMQRLNCTPEEADKFVRIQLRNSIHSLSSRNGGKFILGVTRMWLDGQLKKFTIIDKLDNTIEYISNDSCIDQYDRNLNGLSASELIDKFSDVIDDIGDKEKEDIENMTFDGNSRYKIVRIDSFDEANEYMEYTNWCITQSEAAFNTYTVGGERQFYFCFRDDFEDVDEVQGEGYPLDDYGLSMISVSVDEQGRLKTSTTRWNNGGKIMDATQISQLIGQNFYQVFKPNNKWKNLVNDAMSRIRNGEDMRNVFQSVEDSGIDGLFMVKFRNKFNFINSEGKILSKQWFNDARKFTNMRFGNTEMLLSKIHIFDSGFNYLKPNGELLWKNYFKMVSDFREGFFRVADEELGYNFININGELLCKDWFEDAEDFRNGFATVEIEDLGYNYINTKGEKLLPDEPFDAIVTFNENGYGYVRIYPTWYKVDDSGRIIGSFED